MAARSKLISRLISSLMIVVAIALLGWMFSLGQMVPFVQQMKLYEMLRNVAGTMFAVFGLWIALLYPELRNKVFGRRASGASSEPVLPLETSESRQADHLLMPFFLSLIILLITVIVDVAGPLAKNIDVLVRNGWIVRGLSYAVVGMLAMLLIVSIVGAMRITDGLKAVISRGEKNRDVRKRMRQNRDDQT